MIANQYRLLFNSLKTGEIAVDCGANVGEHTRLMAQNGATVYAFEPNPFAFEVLKENFKNWPNVIPINKGVWIFDGQMRLYFHENSDQDEVKWSSGSSMLSYKSNINPHKYRDVPVIDFIKFINSLAGPIRVVKIDIEGGEGEILRKIIAEGLYARVDKIIVEAHDDKIPELKGIMDQIRRTIRDRKIQNIHLDWM